MKAAAWKWMAGAILLAPALCAGQSTEYKPDLAGRPTARIRIVSTHPDRVTPYHLIGDQCSFEATRLKMPTMPGPAVLIFAAQDFPTYAGRTARA